MCEDNTITAICVLSEDTAVIPVDGINKRELRVDLALEVGKHPTHFAVITVEDELPWYPGERRNVSVRIMSDEFYNRVQSVRPKLHVCYGASEIGTLEINDNNISVTDSS